VGNETLMPPLFPFFFSLLALFLLPICSTLTPFTTFVIAYLHLVLIGHDATDYIPKHDDKLCSCHEVGTNALTSFYLIPLQSRLYRQRETSNVGLCWIRRRSPSSLSTFQPITSLSFDLCLPSQACRSGTSSRNMAV